MTARQTARPTSIDPEGEFPFGAADYVLHLLAAIHQFRDSALDARLKVLGLNVGRYRVLGVLNRFGACTMTELSHFTAIDRTTLTRIADQLVAAEQVERQTTERDRRRVLLALTKGGLEVYGAALGLVFEFNRRILENIPEASHRSTARMLKQVVENLAPDPIARDSIIYFSREALSGEARSTTPGSDGAPSPGRGAS